MGASKQIRCLLIAGYIVATSEFTEKQIIAVRKVDYCLLSVGMMADASPTSVGAVAVYGLTMGLKTCASVVVSPPNEGVL